MNLSDFSRDLGVSVPTVKSWLSVLEAGRIIYLLPPYHSNLGKRITKAPKLYFLDIGLVCCLTGIKDEDHLFRKLFAGWNIKPGMIISLVDQSVPLSDILSATTLPDYLSAIGK